MRQDNLLSHYIFVWRVVLADWQSRLRLSVELEGDWRVDRFNAGVCIVRDSSLKFRVLTFADYQSMIIYSPLAFREHEDPTDASGLSLLRFSAEQAGRAKTDSRSFVLSVDGDLESITTHPRTKTAIPVYCDSTEDALATVEGYIEKLEKVIEKRGASLLRNKRYDLFCMRIEQEAFVLPGMQQRLLAILSKALRLRLSFMFLSSHPHSVPQPIREAAQWQLFAGEEFSKLAEEEYQYQILDVSQRFIPFGLTLDITKEEHYLWSTYGLKPRTLEETKKKDKELYREQFEYADFLGGLVDEE